MQFKKTFAVATLAVLAYPASALAGDVVYSFESAELTLQPSFSFSLNSAHSADADVGSEKGVELFEEFNPTLSYSIGLGVNGQFGSKASKDFQFLFGAQATISTAEGWELKEFQQKDLTDLSTNSLVGGDVYVGLGSPLGNLKYGKLSVNPDGSLVDLGAKFYGRTDVFGITGAQNGAVRYESPQLGSLSFSLTKGVKQHALDVWIPGEGEAATATSPLDLYGATVNYALGDFSVKYVGTVLDEALETAVDGDKTTEYSHRVEGKYTKNQLSFGLGYQYAKTNLGWADGNLSPADGLGAKESLKDTTFKTHEVIASTTYALGKFTPKGFIAYGHGAKSEGKDTAKILPSYWNLGVGVDYALGAKTTLGLSFNKVGFIKTDELSNAGWKNSEGLSLGLSHAF